MKSDTILETERLIVRPWNLSDDDRTFFHRIDSDEQIMQFFPWRSTWEEANSKLQRMISTGEEQGLSWAVAILKETGEHIGFTGLWPVNFDAPFSPTVETGWRYAPEHWRKGFASEASRELLRHGFEDLHLPEIVAFAVEQNAPSINVMKKIGMTEHANSPFDHPMIADKYAHFKRHALYYITQTEWQAQKRPDA